MDGVAYTPPRAPGRVARLRRVAWVKAGAWRREVAGVAAVEFALILPVMLTMFLGMSEVTLGVSIDRKLTLLSRSLADLSSRADTLSASDMTNIFSAASVVMQPYDATALNVVVTSMKVTQVGTTTTYNGSVDWSCSKGTGAVPKPSNVTYTVPNGFKTDGSYYILVEATLPYTPLFGRTLTGTLNLVEVTPWPIRNAAKVTLSGGCPP